MCSTLFFLINIQGKKKLKLNEDGNRKKDKPMQGTREDPCERKKKKNAGETFSHRVKQRSAKK